MKNFKDKVVVITGAASGMGRSYALMFAKLGSKVAICDFDEAGLKETEQLVKQAADVPVYGWVHVWCHSSACAIFCGGK